MSAENTGTVRQPLVGGGTVDDTTQEDFGLLRLGSPAGSCSASLLRNSWAIAAAHCVELKDAAGNRVPDPTRPGQFKIAAPGLVQVSSSWGGGQSQVAVQIETFRPLDIALIKLAGPFEVRGSTTGYTRMVFQDGQFPYFGETVPLLITLFGRGISQFATGSGPTAIPSVSDGVFRLGYAETINKNDNEYWYSGINGAAIAGGDSGGPSFVWVLGGYALVGVHSNAQVLCAGGQVCGNWKGPGPLPANYDPWKWAKATPTAADAPIAPAWERISAIMGPSSPGDDPEPEPPPGFIGTFAKTPANFAPIWVYGIQNDGVLQWYRKNSDASPWQGPQQVGNGWADFADVIAAGGNHFYALTNDRRLLWYQHDGFNDGTATWHKPVEVGRGWTFSKIFAGGDGIVYAIAEDGTLFWYSHQGFRDGGGIDTWKPRTTVGSGWNQFTDVFSSGKGTIYAIKSDGTLLLYQHHGFATGESVWGPPRNVGTGWNDFNQIVPVGDGVILAVNDDGELLWYKDLGPERVPQKAGQVLIDQWKENWQGPVNAGSGWHFKRVFAILPESAPPGPN